MEVHENVYPLLYTYNSFNNFYLLDNNMYRLSFHLPKTKWIIGCDELKICLIHRNGKKNSEFYNIWKCLSVITRSICQIQKRKSINSTCVFFLFIYIASKITTILRAPNSVISLLPWYDIPNLYQLKMISTPTPQIWR
jgi:hypothetical protein